MDSTAAKIKVRHRRLYPFVEILYGLFFLLFGLLMMKMSDSRDPLISYVTWSLGIGLPLISVVLFYQAFRSLFYRHPIFEADSSGMVFRTRLGWYRIPWEELRDVTRENSALGTPVLICRGQFRTFYILEEMIDESIDQLVSKLSNLERYKDKFGPSSLNDLQKVEKASFSNSRSKLILWLRFFQMLGVVILMAVVFLSI